MWGPNRVRRIVTRKPRRVWRGYGVLPLPATAPRVGGEYRHRPTGERVECVAVLDRVGLAHVRFSDEGMRQRLCDFRELVEVRSIGAEG